MPGIPRPQGSRTYYGHRNGRAVLAESSRESRPFHDRVAWTAHAAAWRRPLLTGVLPVAEVEFVMPRPVGTPKTRTRVGTHETPQVALTRELRPTQINRSRWHGRITRGQRRPSGVV